VSAAHAVPAEVRLYDRLFNDPDPEAGDDFVANLKPDSLEVLPAAQVEPSLALSAPGSRYQFERQGYFSVDPDTAPGKLVFNRTVSLKSDYRP